jgi:hypothetical protein
MGEGEREGGALVVAAPVALRKGKARLPVVLPEQTRAELVRLVRQGSRLGVAAAACGLPRGELSRMLKLGKPTRYANGNLRWNQHTGLYLAVRAARALAIAEADAEWRRTNPASWLRFGAGARRPKREPTEEEKRAASLKEHSKREAAERRRIRKENEQVAEMYAALKDETTSPEERAAIREALDLHEAKVQALDRFMDYLSGVTASDENREPDDEDEYDDEDDGPQDFEARTGMTAAEANERWLQRQIGG